MQSLERWQLLEAERRFREALELDPEFALAHLHLAQALYWQWASGSAREADVGPSIGRASAAAMTFTEGLPARDRSHVEAFFTFQEGRLDEARSMYEDLVASDASDVYAWLMRGSVEYEDPLVRRPELGPPRPRANLNVAIEAFTTALRLQPSFEIAYGHLFAIFGQVERVADSGGCTGYAPAGDEPKAVWDPSLTSTPTNLTAFCPVLLDSITWVPRDSLGAIGEADLIGGANRLLDSGRRELRRWAAYRPEEARPLRLMADTWLRERERTPAQMTDRRTTRAQLDSALVYARAAIALARDTVPEDHLQLGRLFLAVDDPVQAEAHLRHAIDLSRHYERPERALEGATSIYLATGRPTEAARIAAAAAPATWMQDPDDGSMIPYGAADSIIRRLEVYGASGVEGAELETSLDRLEALWSDARLPARHVGLLRQAGALTIATALIRSFDRVEEWDAHLRTPDPLWLLLAHTPASTDSLRSLIARVDAEPTSDIGEATRTYLTAWAAQRAGEHSLAIELYARLDALTLRVKAERELGWGLRRVGWLDRATSLEALERTDEALSLYHRYLESASRDDPLTASLIESAERRVALLSGG
jgi:tetratricopeptide (TPR) repeat protein